MSAYVISLTPTNSLWPVTITETVVQVDVLQAFVVGGGGGGGAPDPHASTHVTGGTDKIRDATASQDGLMTLAYAGKLDGIATGANLYVHPNHSGDVVSVGDGATTIQPSVVTLSKIQDIGSQKLIGRHTSGSGVSQEVGLDGGLEFHGANIRREALTGDVTASAGSNSTTIANDAVTNAKAANMPALTIKGNDTGSSADPKDLTVAEARALLGLGGSAYTGLTRAVLASDMIPRSTNGAGIGVIETATNAVNVDVLDFDAATSETANVWPEVPRGVTITGVTIKPRWTAASGSGGVVWSFSARWFNDDDALDQAMGTAQTSADTLLAANDWHIGPATATITPAGTWGADSDLCVVIARLPSDGSDTLGVDARLAGFEITYLT